MPIRIVIADDHAVVRQGLKMFLGLDPDLEVVGEATNGAEALQLAADLQPDVVLMDIAMPVMDGIEATERIREEVPDARVIVLTGSEAPHDISRARAAGATGYVTKDQIAGDLVRAILDAAGR